MRQETPPDLKGRNGVVDGACFPYSTQYRSTHADPAWRAGEGLLQRPLSPAWMTGVPFAPTPVMCI